MISIFWFRRDLRLEDNAGLYHALKGEKPILPLFIFDTEILDKLEDKKDARVEFIHNCLKDLNGELSKLGSQILVKHGKPEEIWKTIINQYDIAEVYTNHDYEPYALERDKQIKNLLKENDISFRTFKDHCIFEKDEVLKDDGDPYKVFTPYSRKWMEKLESSSSGFYLKAYPTEKYFANFHQTENLPFPKLSDLGFEKTKISIPELRLDEAKIKNYGETRDFPAKNGTTRLGIHLRFGTVSIRKAARIGLKKGKTFLNELIWRDFYIMILTHFPHVAKGNFHKKYDALEWRNNEAEFQAWCEGKTGYPIVDAGMRELNETGYMHNRVRMITASFLTKHLLIDWQWGEAYFAKKLLDFDLAANNGGWQWAAGTGTDAQPYFRVFNPESQTKKFDKDGKYLRKWVPEFQLPNYPKPIVEHKFARERAINTYKRALN
ncbi:cryptochrome/photolyase family protein [Flexithrix dorotheae]|uniref:cryptochrome/photolyase family protein n=1 Tax=Flexithrix dorotheae TaxID=70993 RepID=UPI000377F9ED|nr:deoxyribodipyrimidine photo-lyase [Flexithrix dorotheae]